MCTAPKRVTVTFANNTAKCFVYCLRRHVCKRALIGQANLSVRGLVSWCFKLSQPQRIISGLRETFIKRYIIERTNKADITPKEQSEKTKG